MEEQRRPITFTLQELWLLHDFVRHECPDMERWKFPPADMELNEEIALAIDACMTGRLPDYTLDLTRQQLLVIDFLIRHDYKSAQMARGADILLKTFKARREMAGIISFPNGDRNYKEASHAATHDNPDDHADDLSNPAD